MTGPRATPRADSAEHPLRAALASGDRLFARSVPALQHLLDAPDQSLLGEAIVAQVGGMLSDLARQLLAPRGPLAAGQLEAMTGLLLADGALRTHCQALALEWRLAVWLESELALDPVLSPLMQLLVADADAGTAATAMAALAAQARFAQAMRRMQLALGELPAELFHAALLAAREVAGSGDSAQRAETRLRDGYDEGARRLTLLARMMNAPGAVPARALVIEDAGAALWLSALAARSGEERDRTAFAAADPALGRLLLTLRAAGVAPAEAERQALRIRPDAALPRGLEDIGLREAAQWLAQARREAQA